MRRWMAAPLVFAAAAGFALLGDAPQSLAQPKDAPAEETVRTADGVELHCLYHKADPAKGGPDAPVVILLYPPGANNTMNKPGDWEGLARKLSGEGYHVFRFDWRGHGKSRDIKDTQKFWQNPVTGPANQRLIKGANKKPVKNDLDVTKDFNPVGNLAKYYPVFVQDLAAVRVHLDQKNDLGELNTSSVYVIGSGEAAALGMLWITAEWCRPAVHPTLFGGVKYEICPDPRINLGTEAGETIGGAVWLSPDRPQAFSENAVKGWVSRTAPKLRDNNPMLFLYGDKDTKGKNGTNFFLNEVLVANPKPGMPVKKLEQTRDWVVEKAGTLTGANLLGKNTELQTEDTIIKYLSAIQKVRAKIVRKPRQYSDPYFISMGYFGVNAP